MTCDEMQKRHFNNKLMKTLTNVKMRRGRQNEAQELFTNF